MRKLKKRVRLENTIHTVEQYVDCVSEAQSQYCENQCRYGGSMDNYAMAQVRDPYVAIVK